MTPPGFAAAPDRCQVLLWSQTVPPVPLVYAASWWASATVDSYLADKSLPIWVSLAKGHLELYREIQLVSSSPGIMHMVAVVVACEHSHWPSVFAEFPVAPDILGSLVQMQCMANCSSLMQRECYGWCDLLPLLAVRGIYTWLVGRWIGHNRELNSNAVGGVCLCLR